MSDIEEPDAGRVMLVAEQVKQLFIFASMLIPDMDLIEQVARHSSEARSTVDALAPVLGAVGMDWEEQSMEAEVHRARAYALLELIKVLASTETTRMKFKEKQIAKDVARAQLGGILGL